MHTAWKLIANLSVVENEVEIKIKRINKEFVLSYKLNLKMFINV